MSLLYLDLYVPSLLGLLYSISIWTFIYLFCLDSFFQFDLISITVQFQFNFSSISVQFQFNFSFFKVLFQLFFFQSFFILSCSHFGFLPIFFMSVFSNWSTFLSLFSLQEFWSRIWLIIQDFFLPFLVVARRKYRVSHIEVCESKWFKNDI